MSHQLSERIFAALLRLFPAEFRDRFGPDMTDLFADQLRAARARSGFRGVAWLWLTTLPSFVRSALLERRDGATHRPQPKTGGPGMLETLFHDVRFAGRMLKKTPVFTLVAVLVISLGSGAVTTIFSAMNALMLRPLPGTAEPSQLIMFERRSVDGRNGTSASYSYYRYLVERAKSLAGVAAWSKVSLSLASRGEGHAVYGNIVSDNYFTVLGARPALGRFFSPEEGQTPMAHPVVVVSHGFWKSQLAGDSAVVGRTVMVNGHPYTLIGVAPPGFRGVFSPIRTDAWVPLMMQQELRPGRDLDEAGWLWLFGRIKPGVEREAATRELQQLTTAHANEPGRTEWARRYATLFFTAMTGLPSDAKRALLGFAGLLLGAAVLVLLIASVNVASMLSARALARRREMAVRTALGAARSRLVRQLLTETLLLFGMGAIGGVAIAWFATAAFERLPIVVDAAISLELSPDPRVFVFALGLSLVTGIGFGLAPALRGAARDITVRLRDGGAASGTRSSLTSNVLVVSQLALSLVLLVAAGLFIRALRQGAQIDPGFATAGVATATLNTESWGYDRAKGEAFYRSLRERLEALPGVTAVSFADRLPLSASSSGDRIGIDSDPSAAGEGAGFLVQLSMVDPGYFDAIRLPMVRGRAIEATDDARAPRVAVVNETLARRHWPGEDPIGQTFFYQKERVTIIGVARDAKYSQLDETMPAFAYFPLAQRWRPDQVLLVRTATDPVQFALPIDQAVRAIDPVLPRPAVNTFEDAASIVLLPQRVAAIVTAVLGGIGLILATVGLYGVIAYRAGRRSREIGLRMALGARPADVLRLIVREGGRLALIGVTIGVLLAAAVTRLLKQLLFGVSALDGLTFVGMSALFVAVALVASYLPARRASRLDAMEVLRSD